MDWLPTVIKIIYLAGFELAQWNKFTGVLRWFLDDDLKIVEEIEI